jgi:uncharacterized membrane protein
MGRRTLWIGLVVSLAVNLFLIGAVVGGLVIGSRLHAGRPGLRPGPPLWAAADSLSPERQGAYRQALHGEAGDVRGKMREARMVRRQAWLGLRADPFDAKATVSGLDHARALELDARGAVERRIVDFAVTLTPAERAQLADGLARAGPGPRGGRRGPPQGR